MRLEASLARFAGKSQAGRPTRSVLRIPANVFIPIERDRCATRRTGGRAQPLETEGCPWTRYMMPWWRGTPNSKTLARKSATPITEYDETANLAD